MEIFMHTPYYSLNTYLREKFGEKVYKLSLSGGMTCPNRDGKIGCGGCIFCSGDGSGDFAEAQCESVEIQLQKAKRRVQNKIRNGKYIAYFQSFTNTYADVKTLRKLFYEAIQPSDIVALSVATRPDCLPEDVLDLLAEINQSKPVLVELGLQTIHERTAELCRRGYTLPVFDKAVRDLRKRSINTVVHVILGLPYETKEQMLETVRYVGNSGADGIKLQLLHILKGTDLAKLYEQNAFQAMSQSEYIDLLCDCIEVLPPEIVIHRLTGDAPKRLLIAPLWSADKKTVLNAVNRAFRERNVIQGKRWK